MTVTSPRLEKVNVALVALGANLGDPEKTIEEATSILDTVPGIHVIKASSWHRTYPVGFSRDKPLYVNSVVALETCLSPSELLTALQGIEVHLGRVRNEFWDDRTIDLDILLYEDVVLDTEQLTLPHKRLQWRDFVLSPACEIVPDMKIPTFGLTFHELKTLLDWNFRDFYSNTKILYRLSCRKLLP